jgi:hypothetical protein
MFELSLNPELPVRRSSAPLAARRKRIPRFEQSFAQAPADVHKAIAE